MKTLSDIRLSISQSKCIDNAYYFHSYLRSKLYPLYGVMKGIARFINDLHYTYKMSRGVCLCSKCFKRLKGGVNETFEHKGHTYRICNDCYNNQK